MGGDNEPENLQPLCEDCNAGKRDYFRSFEAHAEQIRAAIDYDEPQKRIGELLKTFNGGWVRSDLLGIVASAKNFQEDWQRRLRDLRFLGWDYQHEKRYDEGSRVWTYYRLTKSVTWPENIHKSIRAEEPSERLRSRLCQLARTSRSGLDRAPSRAALIWTPIACATGGGKALPICRYRAVLRPVNFQSESNP